MAEMFTPAHSCPHCAATVARYVGPPFPGVRRVVDFPSGSYHVCIRERTYNPNGLGQQRECICGAPIYQAAGGHKYDPDGEPHYCLEHLLT